MDIIISGNKNSPFFKLEIQEKYLKKYIKLRYDVFNSIGRTHYKPEIESYDLHEDACFIYFVENEEVLGGRRINLHRPGSKTKLKTEESITKQISEVYPNLDTENLMYAELGGLCFHRSIQKKNLSEKMYEFTFLLLRMLKCDFFVAETVPENVQRIIKHAKLNDVQQIVEHPGDKSIDGFGDYRIFMSFKNHRN